MRGTPVQAHIHSVPTLQGGERGSGRFRNSDKVAQLEDGRVDVQTQGFGRTLTWLHDPGNSRAIARAAHWMCGKHRDGAQAESTESELEPDGELDQQRAQEGREEGLRENHC